MNGLATMAGLISLLGAAAPVSEGPPPGRTRYPDRAQCAMNLLEVAGRIRAYAAAHDGRLPSKLSEAFVDAPPGAAGYLVCPAMPPAVVPGSFQPSYAYVTAKPGGRKADDAPNDILAFDAEPIHQNGRNVLFGSLAVKYLEEAAFEKALEAQRDRWQTQGRTLEIVWRDVVPLTDPEIEKLRPAPRSFFASAQLKIAAALVLAILVVLALLIVRSRGSRGAV